MRTYFNIAIFVAVIFTPFWFVLVISFAGLYFVQRWYGLVFAFVIYELLYYPGLDMLPVWLYIPLPVYALVAIIANEWVRLRVRENTV